MRYLALTNTRTKFTRMCIAEAIIELMQKTELDQIRISAVSKKAGVSRMTFYHYYDSLHAALTDYLQEIIAEFLEECGSNSNIGTFLDYSHILFSLEFFDQYSKYFNTLVKHHLYFILIDGINQFMLEHFPTSKNLSIYKMYCYSGGLLNIFLKWEANQKNESAEDIATIIYELFNSKLQTPDSLYY